MNSSLRVFRDLFPFSQPNAEKKAAEVRQLLGTVSGLSSYEVVVELTTHIIPAIVAQPNLHMRFKLLEDARHETEKTLPVLERHIDSSNLPLPRAATTSALAADNLMKALAAGYQNIAREISTGSRQKGLNRLFLRSIRRALKLVTRRQQLAYSTYAKPSPSSWLILHDLYRMARSLCIRNPGEDISHIEYLYLSALLFAYLEPSKLPRNELAVALFCAQQLAPNARIAEAKAESRPNESTAPAFLVRPHEGTPGIAFFRLAQDVPLGEGIIIDCTRVLETIEKTIEASAREGAGPALDVPPGLLHTLQIGISGKSTRRFARKRFKPRADLVGGIAQVIPFIEGNAHSRRSADAVGRHGNRYFVPSEWSLVDQSPDGFLVRFIQGDKWKVGVGNIVALQPRESSHIHVCLVRRVSADSQGHLELGLQALSAEVSVFDHPEHGETRRGICLHSLPARGGRPGVIARPGHLVSGLKLSLPQLGETGRWQVGKRLEGSEGMEFFALLPLPA